MWYSIVIPKIAVLERRRRKFSIFNVYETFQVGLQWQIFVPVGYIKNIEQFGYGVMFSFLIFYLMPRPDETTSLIEMNGSLERWVNFASYDARFVSIERKLTELQL